MDASWRGWVKENLDRGCNPEEIKEILVSKGFPLASIRKEMGNKYPGDTKESGITPGIDHKALAEIPLLKLGRFPAIERFDSPLVQLLTLPHFLTDEECNGIVTLSDKNLRPSTITYASEGFRTSYTCDLSTLNDELVMHVDNKIATALGINPTYSEGIQAQKYKVGEEFKPHTDFFEPGTEEHKQHTGPRGQRTWTFMIYLNTTPKGGGTHFMTLDKTFYPEKGKAVIWNNLNVDGSPNRDTLHWGMPVEKGNKYIITKWFREKGPGNCFA